MIKVQKFISNEIRATHKVWPGFILGMVLLLSACTLPAQENSAVKNIRQTYQQVNADIANCKGPDDPCGYYLNILEVNKKSEPWPVVGIFMEQRNFWYTGEPSENGMDHILRKVNVKTQRSARQENQEFLFDANGDLMFYFFEMPGGEEDGQEQRFYFADGKLVHYLEKVSAPEADYQRWTKTDAANVLEEAKRMKNLFRLSVN